jgi:hypothetical protein
MPIQPAPPYQGPTYCKGDHPPPRLQKRGWSQQLFGLGQDQPVLVNSCIPPTWVEEFTESGPSTRAWVKRRMGRAPVTAGEGGGASEGDRSKQCSQAGTRDCHGIHNMNDKVRAMVKWETCDRRVVTLYFMCNKSVMPEPVLILQVA